MIQSRPASIACLIALLVQGAAPQGKEGSATNSAESPILSAPGWPHVRGPDYSGVSAETNIADWWPLEGPPVLWRVELGKGYSSFAAVDDRVFTQFQTIAGQYVVCLDAESGSFSAYFWASGAFMAWRMNLYNG